MFVEVLKVLLHQIRVALDDEQILRVFLLGRLREVERSGNDRASSMIMILL